MRTHAEELVGTWTLDPRASTATFVAHQMWMTVPGTIPFLRAMVEIGSDGHLISGSAELDLSRIDTGNTRRERDLAKPALLDIDRCPTLTLEVGASTHAPDGWSAPATVSARGGQCPCRLEITTDGGLAGDTAHVIVTSTLDLTPLRIRAPRFAIGRRVEVRAEAVFRRVGQPPR